jgi:hypothetical protein
MRTEDYYEQKLRIPCSQPHTHTEDKISPSTLEHTTAEEEPDTQENQEAATAMDDITTQRQSNHQTKHREQPKENSTRHCGTEEGQIKLEQEKKDAQKGSKRTNQERNTTRLGEANKQAPRRGR